jgi:uncharacterized repeat protein (TIGR03843 family)
MKLSEFLGQILSMFESHTAAAAHINDTVAATSMGPLVNAMKANNEALRKMAAFDAVVNNADRKGGHVLVDLHGQVFGIDHGVTFNEEDKLRTVLWGWAGEPLDDSIIEALARLDESLQSPTAAGLRRLLTRQEIRITRDRVHQLLEQARFPYPGDGWPSLPWPAF